MLVSHPQYEPTTSNTNKYYAVVIEALEREIPGIFGPNGGHARIYSIQGVAYTTGMLIGPELSGLLTNTVGYHVMTMVLGTENPSQTPIRVWKRCTDLVVRDSSCSGTRHFAARIRFPGPAATDVEPTVREPRAWH